MSKLRLTRNAVPPADESAPKRTRAKVVYEVRAKNLDTGETETLVTTKRMLEASSGFKLAKRLAEKTHEGFVIVKSQIIPEDRIVDSSSDDVD